MRRGSLRRPRRSALRQVLVRFEAASPVADRGLPDQRWCWGWLFGALRIEDPDPRNLEGRRAWPGGGATPEWRPPARRESLRAPFRFLPARRETAFSYSTPN